MCGVFGFKAMDLFSLPKDCLTSIFRRCDHFSLHAVSKTCSRFRTIVFHDFVTKAQLFEWTWQDSKSKLLETGPGNRFFPLDFPFNIKDASRILASFVVRAGSNEDGLPSYVSFGVHQPKRKEDIHNIPSMPVVYFADGDVWSLGSQAPNQGSSSRRFAFKKGMIISVLVERNLQGLLFGDSVYKQDAFPNCCVTFFRDQVMVHKPFLIRLDEGEFFIGLNSPRLCMEVETLHVSAKQLHVQTKKK